MEFISAFDNKEVGRERPKKVTSSRIDSNRNYKGINLFNANDLTILLAILHGEFNISGIRKPPPKRPLGRYSFPEYSPVIKLISYDNSITNEFFGNSILEKALLTGNLQL